MARSSHLDAVYCTDEDVYGFAPSDFGVFIPASNCYGFGSDGAVSGWTLTSASNDFTAQGVTPGMVLQLAEPIKSFQPKRSLSLAVDTVGTTSLTFRHCGEDPGKGMSPVASAGLAGVTFSILSLKLQIENAAFKINEQFSLDPNLAYRTPTDVYDIRVFRDLTAYWVAYHLYANANRTKDGDFAQKIVFYQQEYEKALETASVRWGPRGQSQPSTTRFGMRLSR